MHIKSKMKRVMAVNSWVKMQDHSKNKTGAQNQTDDLTSQRETGLGKHLMRQKSISLQVILS